MERSLQAISSPLPCPERGRNFRDFQDIEAAGAVFDIFLRISQRTSPGFRLEVFPKIHAALAEAPAKTCRCRPRNLAHPTFPWAHARQGEPACEACPSGKAELLQRQITQAAGSLGSSPAAPRLISGGEISGPGRVEPRLTSADRPEEKKPPRWPGAAFVNSGLGSSALPRRRCEGAVTSSSPVSWRRFWRLPPPAPPARQPAGPPAPGTANSSRTSARADGRTSRCPGPRRARRRCPA